MASSAKSAISELDVTAARILQATGLEVINMTGGFGAWTDAELPVDQPEATDVCDWHTKHAQCEKENIMKESLPVVGVLVVWFVLNSWVLPKFGVKT